MRFVESPPPVRLSQQVGAARGRARSHPYARQPQPERDHSPTPLRSVVEQQEEEPEEDNDCLIVAVHPNELTGFLGPIQTQPSRRSGRRGH